VGHGRSGAGVAGRTALVMLLALVLSATAWAQWGWQGGRLPEGRRVLPEFLPEGMSDGAFAVCKLMYTSNRREEGGGGWSTDYPYAGHNLMIRLSELTRTRISRRPPATPGEGTAPMRVPGEPPHWVVDLMDDSLFECPFLMAADVGTMSLSPYEAERLREYLLKGGFLWVDDFWGTAAWEQWSREIRAVLPDHPIIDVPDDHPIRRMLFTIDTVPQVPNIGFWRRTGGLTAERYGDSPHANFRKIADEHGRIMVLMTHNTDIADSWEREGEDPDFFLQFSPDGYALGVNVVLYALTR
jgi:hypothetical protein